MKFPPILGLRTALQVGAFILLTGTAQSQLEQKSELTKPAPQSGSLAPDFSLKLGAKTETSVTGDKISTRHAEISTHLSDPTIAAGNRFSLTVDVEPHSNIHIYAPGAKGYREVSLSIEPNPQIRALPLQYPASETYTFLNQPVPVFQKPFRLVQDLILSAPTDSQAPFREKGSLTIRGTLEYQACDEKMCFFPVSVPLSWTMNLRPHVQPETNRP